MWLVGECFVERDIATELFRSIEIGLTEFYGQDESSTKESMKSLWKYNAELRKLFRALPEKFRESDLKNALVEINKLLAEEDVEFRVRVSVLTKNFLLKVR